MQSPDRDMAELFGQPENPALKGEERRDIGTGRPVQQARRQAMVLSERPQLLVVAHHRVRNTRLLAGAPPLAGELPP